MNGIALSIYDWIYGTSAIAAAFLSVVAGILAMTLFKAAFKEKHLHAWRFLIFSLVFFGVEEVLGALKIFGIYRTPHLTHVVPGFILAFLIAALVNEIWVNKERSYE